MLFQLVVSDYWCSMNLTILWKNSFYEFNDMLRKNASFNLSWIWMLPDIGIVCMTDWFQLSQYIEITVKMDKNFFAVSERFIQFYNFFFFSENRNFSSFLLSVIESFNIHYVSPGLPCPTLLRPAGRPPLKQPYGRFRSGLPTGLVACSHLLPP